MLARTMESISKRPILGAIALGAVTAIATSIVGFFLSYFLPRIIPERLWGTLDVASIAELSPATVFLFVVVIYPLFETVLAQLIPLEITRRLTGNAWSSILVGAIVFGGSHYLSSGLIHGITTFFTGALLAALYVVLRRNGPASSFVGVATAHILHNAILLYVLTTLFPLLA